jgi:hypothetical protein
MSKVSENSLTLIQEGVDLMCNGTREGFPQGLSVIVGLLPDHEALNAQYRAIAESTPDQDSYIDQAAIRSGAHACSVLSVLERDSTPLGTYLERFNHNRKYGNIPRQLAKIVISEELQKACAEHDYVLGGTIYEIGDSTRLLLPSDRLFVAARNIGWELLAMLRLA